MEDPWSTPWAVDDPSASPGLPPPRKEFKDAPSAGGFERSSPWGDVASRQYNGGEDEDENEKDNGWDGWDDGKRSAWDARIAPLEEPADGLATPWGTLEEGNDRHVPDSAMAAASLGVRTVARVESKATMLLEDEQDAWTAPRERDLVIVAAPDEELARAEEAKGTEEVQGVVREEEEEEPGGSTLDWQSQQQQQQQQQQKASKVQELVEMYDGIAKEAVRPAAEPAMRESKSAGSAEAPSEHVLRQHHVYGDVSGVAKDDDSVDNQGTTAIAADAQSPGSQELGLIEKVPSSNDGVANEQRESAPINTAHDNTSNEQLNPQQAQLATTQPTIQNALYPINFSHLDDLFPSSKPPSDTPPASIPDNILPSTSFNTTSERKTWYRVSRLGSARFHDHGDDEAAYRRVAWPSSNVRTKTLDIVRRWMEQDSIAGRVVLGGGRKAGGPLGASMFGWDDGAPQVEIGELLLRRRQQQRSGHTDSKGSSMAERGEDGVREKTQMMETAGVRPLAEMPRSPWDDDDEPPSKQRSSLEAMPPPPRPAEADAWMESISEPAPAQDESLKEGEYGNDDDDSNDDDDDDDDWGEMVSSPTVNASTAFASFSAPVAPTPQQPSSEAALNGLGFVESSAAKPVRSNPPPPIRTAGISGLDSSAAAPSSSPMWTPTLNSPPTLEPTTRVSMDSVSRAKPAVVHGASTPALEAPRASTSSNRVSAELVWTPAASTPTTTTEHRLSIEHAWTATPATNNSAFMETPWTPKVVGPVSATTPSGTSVKHSMDKSVSATDTCIADERSVVDEALKGLPDLSYMLH